MMIDEAKIQDARAGFVTLAAAVAKIAVRKK